MTRVAFKIVDKHGNVLPYATSVVSFEIEGNADLIGDNPFPLVGGQAALYLRARETIGSVTITAKANRLSDATVTVEFIKKPSEEI